jgi:hypothetical protein
MRQQCCFTLIRQLQFATQTFGQKVLQQAVQKADAIYGSASALMRGIYPLDVRHFNVFRG